MNKFLSGKKILFITTKYFGYEREIAKSLQAYGAELKVYYDDPTNYTGIKHLKNWLNPRTLSRANKLYRAFILRKTARLQWDYVLILKGAIMTEAFMEALHANHPTALFIQYQWDSLHNFNYERFIKYFNVNLTFDPGDAARHPDLHYLPTFALDEFFIVPGTSPKINRNIDISFVGSNHSNRLRTLRGLRRRLKEDKLTYKFYVYLPLLVSIRSVLITRKMRRDEFMWGSLSKKKYKALLRKSRYVLDLPSPTQTGVPLRTYEALASGCCLITTNKLIALEPFFNDKHVFIIDQTALEESVPALVKQNTINQKLLSFEEYSLSSWTKKLFALATSGCSLGTEELGGYNDNERRVS
jgi:hypothetical protein